MELEKSNNTEKGEASSEEIGNASDAESGAESDEVLFPYKVRDDVKPNSESDDDDDDDEDSKNDDDENSKNDDDENSKNDDDENSKNDDDEGCDFNSSPEVSRVRRSKVASPSGATTADAIDFSSDDEEERKFVPKRRRGMDEDAMQAIVNATIEDNLRSDDEDGESLPRTAAADREFQSRIKDKIARAERLDLPTRSCARGGARGGPSRAAAEAVEALKQAAAARSKREIDARRVKLTMVRSKHRRHVFHTKLGSRVGAIEEACREQVALVSRDEQGADLCLYHEESFLHPACTLSELGLRGDATIRLDVKGGEVPDMKGDPLTLMVKVEGGKPFKAETTTEMKYKTFMEGFIAAVGIPLERASECVFKLDGDRLDPEGTPQGEDLENGDQIDATFPADVMTGVQASPDSVNLLAPLKKAAAMSRVSSVAFGGARQEMPERMSTQSTSGGDGGLSDGGGRSDSDGCIVLD